MGAVKNAITDHEEHEWADALMASSIVKGSVVDTFYEEFEKNLKRRGFWVAELFEKKAAAAE